MLVNKSMDRTYYGPKDKIRNVILTIQNDYQKQQKGIA